MKLVVFHYHDRPGGVRQVIRRGLPMLLERMTGVIEVVLLLGESCDAGWIADLARWLKPVRLRVVVEAEFGYLVGGEDLSPAAVSRLHEVLSGPGTVCWAHNLSVARNIPLLCHLPEACRQAGAELWLHHHDWWWDGRWVRWADWQESGVRELEEALEWSVPRGQGVRHFCISLTDFRWLHNRVGDSARWVGNPLPDPLRPAPEEVARAAVWLREKSGGRKVWLAPVRALRRKNLAEALLLAQGQEEPTCLVTTGAASSPAEAPAWEEFREAARAGGWPLVPGVLAEVEAGPSVPALMAAADVIAMPSLQEGFGLPYLEAAALEQPMVARNLPDVRENLDALGCGLPWAYSSLPVPPETYNSKAEQQRVMAGWKRLEIMLPRELRDLLLNGRKESGGDFGGLTLTGQLEVLRSGWKPEGLIQAEVPVWGNAGRDEKWVERMLGEPAGGQNIRPPGNGPVDEVRRRFEYWAAHPLLWP